MKHRVAWFLLIALTAAGVLAACSDDAAPPGGDPAILTGFDALPKQIVTIALTPTPTPVIVGAQPVTAIPTTTAGPPRPTATLTPYVGIFLGQPTSESGEPAPTLAPFSFNAGGGVPVESGVGEVVPSGSASGCTMSVAGQFSAAYTAVQNRLGCPVSGGTSIAQMVLQSFERGSMYWRSDFKQIYALASNGQYWQVPDTWTEGMPADDPAFAAPAGVLQPVRGFGLAWRSNSAIRDALGWATAPEALYAGFWQDFERGAMFQGEGGRIYALFTAEGQHSGPIG